MREEPDTRQVVAVEARVAASEQLIAAADGEQRSAAGHRRVHRIGVPGQVVGDERLLAVLPAADVEQVVRVRVEQVADADGGHAELVPSPGRAHLEHRDVAAVGVDVEVVRIEVPDADPHEHPAAQNRR